MTLVVEQARLAAVARYDILDATSDDTFNRIATLAARLLDAPTATVTIVDSDRTRVLAAHGLASVTRLGRHAGLCASAIEQDEPYWVADTANDPRCAENPLVCGPMGIRFYAAAPIITADGHRLGTVNVLGTHPREAREGELATLADLAAIVMDELELRRLGPANGSRHAS